MCAKRGEVCRPQTEQTKKLVLPKNRSWKKQIAGLEQDPPCRGCFKFTVPCLLVDPAGSQCDRCRKLNRNCVWDLEGAKKSKSNENRKAARKQAAQERRGFTAVPQDQKCYRCANRRIACDGRHPCNKCTTKRLSACCRPQGVEQLPTCVHCSSVNAHCDRGRPCKRCINKKRTCSYEAQGGLLFRSYTVPDGPVPKGFASVGALVEGESSDDECVRCQRRKLNCSGGQPCYRCVRDQTTFQIAQCNYRHSDGTYDSWTVRPFQLDELGQPSIREEYENYTGRKRNTSKEVKALINTPRTRRLSDEEDLQPQLDDTVNDDIGERAHSALQEAAKDRIKRFKFGLSAYRKQAAPLLELKLSSSTNAKYYEAKKEELKSHEEKGTWQVVPLPEGIKPVTSRWVNTDKYGPDGRLLKHKSRLVARGFQQEEGIDYSR